jgi:hypothetical protein
VNQVIDMNLDWRWAKLRSKVEATAALLQTSDSQVGTVVENKQIVDLSLAARDFMQLSLLAPGVVESRDNIRHQASRGTWQGSFSSTDRAGNTTSTSSMVLYGVLLTLASTMPVAIA